jgi:hypothetical protein
VAAIHSDVNSCKIEKFFMMSTQIYDEFEMLSDRDLHRVVNHAAMNNESLHFMGFHNKSSSQPDMVDKSCRQEFTQACDVTSIPEMFF